MSNSSGTIKYWVKPGNYYPTYYRADEAVKGTIPMICREIGNAGEFSLEAVTEHDGNEISAEDALEMLKNGELDMVFGLAVESFDSEGLEVVQDFYEDELVAVILPESAEQPMGSVENYYWGIESDMLSLTTGTAFEGHTLGFNGKGECEEALKDGSVFGILIRRSELDYAVFVSKDYSVREFASESISYSECIYLNPENTALNAVIAEISGNYSDTESDYRTEYTNMLLDRFESTAQLKGIALGGCAAAVVLAVVCAIVASKLSNSRKSHVAAMKTLLEGDPDKEMFELDLHSRKLYACKDFAVFGVNPGRIPNPVSLDELSVILGYNFNEHFSKVSETVSTVYRNRMIIHVNGQKKMISEDGRRCGHILYITMTDVT